MKSARKVSRFPARGHFRQVVFEDGRGDIADLHALPGDKLFGVAELPWKKVHDVLVPDFAELA
ncbi:MAG: hypothetical protein DMG27_20335, partial [Acidobacteria bacterium]